MLRILVLTMAIWVVTLSGCGDETVYDWQRPHDTYQVGSFSQYQNAEKLKSNLQKNGFDSRIETEIKNGQFYLNVMVDVYNKAPDTVAKLESISGVKPYLRNPKGNAAGQTATKPASPLPGQDI